MIHAFRLRLALSSAVLAGFVLVAFGLSTHWLIRDVKVEHIDRVISSDAEREAGRPPMPTGWVRVERDFAANLGLRNMNDLVLLVQDAKGRIVYSSAHWPAPINAAELAWPMAPDSPPPRPDAPQPRPRPVTRVIDQTAGDQAWRIGLAVSDRARVAVGVSLAPLDEEMRDIRHAFLIAVPLALLLIGLGAWALSSRALRPIEKLTLAARRVTAERLDQRLSVAGEDVEFVNLIEVFNGMLARLERSFQQARRFSADAAHELRTPLAILQGQLERAINAAEAGSAMQTTLTGILDEVRRLSTISRKLLLLAQADAGRMSLNRQQCRVSHMLRELVDDMQMLAPSLQITADIDSDIDLDADAGLLQQLFHNLASNAIKYNVPSGWVHLSASLSQGQVKLCFANSSPGIPVGAREHIFERFFRADPAHNRKIEGVGLGLALSREIARAHGGELSFDVADDGEVRFSLVLPR